MPFYEYECQACKFYTEVMQKISDAPLIKCPSCGKRKLKKLVSAPVFRLKGGGWYETDFKSDNESKRNLAGADKEEGKSEGKSEAKSDSKDSKDGKDMKDSKDSKPEAKETKVKESEAKPEKPKASGSARSVSVTSKASRSAARRPAKAAAKSPKRRR